MKKHLHLFTANYPFSQGEHLLEYEIVHLKTVFDKITLITSDVITKQQFKTSDDIDIVRYNPKSTYLSNLFALRFLFHSEVISELKNIKKLNISLSFRLFFEMLDSYSKALKIKSLLIKMRIKNPNYDNFYYSWWTTEFTLGFSLLKKDSEEIKIVTRARAIDLYFERHKTKYLPFRTLIYKQLNSIFCISNQGRDYLLNTFNFLNLDPKIKIMRMGSINRKPLDQRLNNDPLTLVSCSNIIALKRIDLIIKALSLINNINIKWIHFGIGDLEEEIKNVAQKLLEEKKNIKYIFKGFVSNHELMNYYSNHTIDLFINVSEYEGIPVSIMESFSYGIPAIATNVGGVSEIIDSQTGFLLDKDIEPEDISEVINTYWFLSSENKKKLKSAAYSKWDEYFNADKNFKAISNLISSL